MKLLALSILVVADALGCAGESSQPSPSEAPPISAPPGAPSTSAKAEVAPALEPTLLAYDALRAKLALDDFEAVPAAAKSLAKSAGGVVNELPEALRAHVASVARHAAELGKMPTSDPTAVRKAFGEVSRAVVALLTAEPSLREGVHIFECPMAPGYRKWVQRGEKKQNPYMGQSMPTCGSSSDWSE